MFAADGGVERVLLNVNACSGMVFRADTVNGECETIAVPRQSLKADDQS
jgi:hypothetical protein